MAKGVAVDVVCFVHSFDCCTKKAYIGCPNCKFEVSELSSGRCISCDLFYHRPKHYCFIRAELRDCTGSLEATITSETIPSLLGIAVE